MDNKTDKKGNEMAHALTLNEAFEGLGFHRVNSDWAKAKRGEFPKRSAEEQARFNKARFNVQNAPGCSLVEIAYMNAQWRRDKSYNLNSATQDKIAADMIEDCWVK